MTFYWFGDSWVFGDELEKQVGADLTNEQWQLQQPYVEKYIRPCDVHPNQAGHQKIAQEIIKLLTNE